MGEQRQGTNFGWLAAGSIVAISIGMKTTMGVLESTYNYPVRLLLGGVVGALVGVAYWLIVSRVQRGRWPGRSGQVDSD